MKALTVEGNEMDIEGKYFLFIFRCDYFNRWGQEDYAAVFRLKNGKLVEKMHPIDNTYNYDNKMVKYFQRRKITEVFSTDFRTKKLFDKDMEYKYKTGWIKYLPISCERKSERNIFTESTSIADILKENNINLILLKSV